MYEVYAKANWMGWGRRQWRWRFRAKNHEIIAVSSEGYNNKSECLHSITLVSGGTANSSNIVMVET